jgi:uncharacterized protein YecT (DUF1311 family)
MSPRRAFAPCFIQILAFLAGLLSANYAIVAAAQSVNDPNELCASAASTAETFNCLDGAYKAANHSLNTLYVRIQKGLGPDELASLVSAERLWLQYRDATCEAEYKLYGGGTNGPPARTSCLLTETRARIASLSRSYGWRLEKIGG